MVIAVQINQSNLPNLKSKEYSPITNQGHTYQLYRCISLDMLSLCLADIWNTPLTALPIVQISYLKRATRALG